MDAPAYKADSGIALLSYEPVTSLVILSADHVALVLAAGFVFSDFAGTTIKCGFPTLFLLADFSTFLSSLHQYPSDIVKRLVLCTGVKSTAPQAGTREKTCDHQLNYNYDTVALSMITR